MILTSKEELHRYSSLHPRFPQAFRFLNGLHAQEFGSGRIELEGSSLYALASTQQGKSAAGAFLEAHRRYIDIQYVVSGVEKMGWRPLSLCTQVKTPYDPEKEIEFFADQPVNWCAVQPGMAAIFFPEDAHAPMVSEDVIHKIILKVLL
jgi:biofilm protein TabA